MFMVFNATFNNISVISFQKRGNAIKIDIYISQDF